MFDEIRKALDAEIQVAWARGQGASQQSDEESEKSAFAILSELRDLRSRLDILASQLPRIPNPVETPAPVVVSPQASPPAKKIDPPVPVVAPSASEPSAPTEPVLAEEDRDFVELPTISRKRRVPTPEERNWNKRARAFHERLKTLDDSRRLTESDECLVKSLVTEIRGIQVLAEAIQQDPNLDFDFQELRHRFNNEASDPEFFGFNATRSHRAEIWFEVSKAYELLAHAVRASQWLSEEHEASSEELKNLFLATCAADAYLYRCFLDYGMMVSDGQQKRLHDGLLALQREEWFVPYWRSQGEDRSPIAEIVKVAESLPTILKTLVDKTKKRELGNVALTELRRHTENPQDGEFEDKLCALVDQALAGGIPPTNKELNELLLPFRNSIDGLTSPQSRKLRESLGAKATLLAKQGVPQEIQEDSVEVLDPDTQQKLDQVRDALKGKTMLFLGGNKGQTARRESYEKALGLKEFIWPDVEDATNLNKLYPSVAKADVVCLLIRWSRHHYKVILDEAKRNEKLTVTFPNGYGFNTIVHGLHQRLFPATAVEVS